MKAYDCINYDILLKKLENAGIRGEILKWFRSYITGRMQSCDVNGYFSDLLEIRPHPEFKPQLPPLHYIHQRFFNSTNLFSLAFADDTSIAIKHKNFTTMTATLNQELTKIYNWYSANKFTLNIQHISIRNSLVQKQ